MDWTSLANNILKIFLSITLSSFSKRLVSATSPAEKWVVQMKKHLCTQLSLIQLSLKNSGMLNRRFWFQTQEENYLCDCQFPQSFQHLMAPWEVKWFFFQRQVLHPLLSVYQLQLIQAGRNKRDISNRQDFIACFSLFFPFNMFRYSETCIKQTRLGPLIVST